MPIRTRTRPRPRPRLDFTEPVTDHPNAEPVTSRVAGEDMRLSQFEISTLRKAEYNPRKMTAAQKLQLKQSLAEFGLVEPVIVNMHPDRLHIVVGGHQRLTMLEEEGFTACMCVVVNLPIEQERKLNLRLNKNNGEWDYEKLGEFFTESELSIVGFNDAELNLAFADESTADGTASSASTERLAFSPSLNEARDYLVLTFDNETDRNALFDRLGLGRVKSTTGSAKGLQRVISARQLLALLP